MADPKYINKTDATGIHITEAAPMDDRMYLKSANDETLLAGEEPFKGIMYDGMVVQMEDSRKTYIWVESVIGLIDKGYTYPEYMNDVQGHNYANKTYNLVLFDKINTVHVSVNTKKGGYWIEGKDIPYHILKDLSAAQIVLKSSQTGFLETELPDTIEVYTNSIKIVIADTIENETFKATIS